MTKEERDTARDCWREAKPGEQIDMHGLWEDYVKADLTYQLTRIAGVLITGDASHIVALVDAVKPLEHAPGFGDVDGLADYEEIEVRITIGQVRAIQSALAAHEKGESCPKSLDALVEAVRNFVDGELCGGYDKPTFEHQSLKNLESALVVCEKTIRDVNKSTLAALESGGG